MLARYVGPLAALMATAAAPAMAATTDYSAYGWAAVEMRIDFYGDVSFVQGAGGDQPPIGDLLPCSGRCVFEVTSAARLENVAETNRVFQRQNGIVTLVNSDDDDVSVELFVSASAGASVRYGSDAYSAGSFGEDPPIGLGGIELVAAGSLDYEGGGASSGSRIADEASRYVNVSEDGVSTDYYRDTRGAIVAFVLGPGEQARYDLSSYASAYIRVPAPPDPSPVPLPAGAGLLAAALACLSALTWCRAG